jgi:beta-phosphoglucomutase-like phosphatase (HAD superfamily)
LRAIGFGEQIQRSLYGGVPATALRSIADFHLGGTLPAAPFQSALDMLYRTSEQLAGTAQGVLDVIDILERLRRDHAAGSSGSAYPESELGLALRQTAQLIKADVGLEVACIDLGGWNTHIAQDDWPTPIRGQYFPATRHGCGA